MRIINEFNNGRLMNAQNITYVDTHKVSCEGLESGIGHPKVYLEIKDEQITCPYCSKIFKLKSKSHENN